MNIAVQLEYLLRILLAAVCGIIIGYERKKRGKGAGIRTHLVVALASSLMMIISKYGFADMTIGENGVRGADGARIAAQIVSGVGFLGAGMIYFNKNSVRGLTTAARDMGNGRLRNGARRRNVFHRDKRFGSYRDCAADISQKYQLAAP